MNDIVNSIEKYRRGWTGGLPETPCGFGSKIENTVEQRQWIPEIVKKYGIKTVADIGCGDQNWINLLDWDVEYSAYDLVPRTPDTIEFNLVTDIPPKVDMLMCLWVLNHFPEDDREKAIQNILLSGSKYLMVSDRPIWNRGKENFFNKCPLEKIILNYKGLVSSDKQDNIQLIRIDE